MSADRTDSGSKKTSLPHFTKGMRRFFRWCSSHLTVGRVFSSGKSAANNPSLSVNPCLWFEFKSNGFVPLAVFCNCFACMYTNRVNVNF